MKREIQLIVSETDEVIKVTVRTEFDFEEALVRGDRLVVAFQEARDLLGSRIRDIILDDQEDDGSDHGGGVKGVADAAFASLRDVMNSLSKKGN